MSEIFSTYLYRVTFALILIAFALGLLTGIGLLSYSGREPVNVIYFIAVVIFFPLLTMSFTLITMLRASSAQNVLIHLSPAFWMEKVLSMMPAKVEESIKTFQINPLLANWIILKRSQIIVLFFSFGLLLALLGVVVTKDIAFAWSTTLHISPQELHEFLTVLALPWREILPSALPSLELIEQSQYFRLGEKLDEEMITHASQLGEWWKFLAMATIFYSILLRILMLILVSLGYSRALKRSFLTLKGTTKLLREINEPIISTHAKRKESTFTPNEKSYEQIVSRLDASYDCIHGWAIPYDRLLLLGDSMQVIAPNYFEAGGTNSFEEDNEVISKSHGEVLLLVKAWEPPTMDFIDYLNDLAEKVDKVVIMPIGTKKNDYEAMDKEIDVWDSKLSMLQNMKVWLKR